MTAINMTGGNYGNYGPRIYNLFPRLLGPISYWYDHIERIKKMEFDWIYVNPLNYPGFSGSLYAIKDFFKFNPMFAPEDAVGEDRYSWRYLRDFIEKVHENGLKFMYDLVINHTSIDSPLINEHPEWFTEKWALVHKRTGAPVRFFDVDPSGREPEYDRNLYPEDKFRLEKRIASPYAVDPDDPNRITIWGDLAEINNLDNSDMNELTEFWMKLIEFYLDLGMDGFRCDAAYKVPPDMWRSIIDHAKTLNPDVIFLAETLGCTPEQIRETVDAGFDYINNSSKWWDYTAPWLIEQYNEFRKYCPSVGFPESHDTERVAAESGGRLDVQKFKYFFAAYFSAGVMMPIGYEWGFRKKLDVVKMTPDDWEDGLFDISDFIRDVNRFKKSLKCLNEDGPIVHFNYPDTNILVMKKSTEDGSQQLLLIYNKDWHNDHPVSVNLSELFGNNRTVYVYNIRREGRPYRKERFEKMLKPNEYHLFLQM